MALRTLGDHLRKERLDRGLQQKDVASALSVDTDTIYNWENNRTVPARRMTDRIAKFIGRFSCLHNSPS